MNGPLQLGAFNYDPAAQQKQIQEKNAMLQQIMQQRQAQAQRAQAQQAQAQAQQPQGGGVPGLGGMAQAAGQAGGGQAGGGQAGGAPPSLMEQLGTYGSPANSALMNFGLETLNSANQGGSTIGSLMAGLGGGYGAYMQGKHLQSQNASLAERDEFDRRMRDLQLAEMQERLRVVRGAGAPGSAPSYARQAPGMY